MERDLILYFDGGAMCGIFGGGVVGKLEQANIYPRIKAIYAGSAGAFNAAYFLARQTAEGRFVYFDYLSKDFLNFNNFLPGIIQRIINRVHPLPHDKILNVMDVDYAIDVVKNKIPLNADYIKNQPIPLYIKVLNLRTKKTEYLLDKNFDIFKLLRASACMAPYTFEKQKINEDFYIDGTIKDPVGLKKLINKYPTHKILYISNNKTNLKFRHSIKSLFEGMVAGLMYGKEFLPMFLERDKKMRKDISLAQSNPNILSFYAPKNNPTNIKTRNRKTLKKTYQLGLEEGEKIVNTINNL